MLGFTENMSFLLLLSFFTLQFIFAYILGEILLKFATNLGVHDHGEGVVRWTHTTKASLGGIVFFFSFLLSVVFYLIIQAETSILNKREFVGMVIVCILGFLMGLADDAYNTKPWFKFIIQILCGVVAILFGSYIHIFSNENLNYIITILWFVGIMNSLNMLDNLDAITTSVSIVACIFMLIFAVFNNTLYTYDSILLIGVLASLIAFLKYNWNPSKMYMGDSGSQFLGAFMAYASIKVLWNIEIESSVNISKVYIMLLPVSFFIITISDTTTVFINRLLKKKSPFVGGKDHTTHHFVYSGLSQRKVALLYIFISTFCSVVGFIIYYLKIYDNKFIVFSFAFLLFLVFISLFIITKTKKDFIENE